MGHEPRAARLSRNLYPQLTVDAREVFGGDIAELLLHERYELASAPMTSYPRGFRHQTVRRERLRVALGDGHPLARSSIELSELRDQTFEICPRDPQHRRGYIARGHGVGLINASLAEQLPPGTTLVDLDRPGSDAHGRCHLEPGPPPNRRPDSGCCCRFGISARLGCAARRFANSEAGHPVR
jgi:hypothetical protein